MSNENQTTSRRNFLKKTTVATAATAGAIVGAGSLAAPAVHAQTAILLKMQSSWPSSDIFQDMAKQYVERVEAMSGGRLKIDLLPAGAVVGAFQVQDACHDGIIDAAHTVPVYWYGKNKAASLFGTGPVFGANAAQMIAWLYHGGGYEFYRELTQDILGLDIVGFMGFPMPAQPLGWFKKPIENASQLKGLKYRTVGLAADLFQAMGASVAQLPGGEIVPAMERGVIDAFEFNNPTSDMRFGSQDVAKNYMLSSYHQASESFEFIFNKRKFESLPKDLQAVLKYGVESAHTANYALAMHQYSMDLDKLQKESGVKAIRTPDSVLKEQLAAWDKILPPLMKDAYFAKVVESQKKWCERVVFYDLMNAPDYKLAYQHYFPGKITF
ncbi:MAG: TRAP transporter substrate-binding protein [Alphaproteobacteria bacterium]|nr:TRAP transporter substrate-binding protein [Alphaproteobacteria bacterium]MBU0796350.1 TRAP transporter substrate-binding protein [Alphaproteobacteria bacterium]MBU0887761.1 TRAP transporter substrate-binding protein [Alphaproteobacteria bacterium]MBU1815016.1 TRAP transporter substrate-binding protein [Alphaproteobacteria bacterium]